MTCAPPTVAQPSTATQGGGGLLRLADSLLAFGNAPALGVDFLETDVHVTAAGEVVTLHDPSLDCTTTGTGPAAEHHVADLGSVRLRAAAGASTAEPLPILAQLLDLSRIEGCS